MGQPDFLVIGHVAKDLIDDGYRLGGTVAYSALTARNLGRKAAVVTCAGPDVDLRHLFNDIDLVCLPSRVTTTFRNVYSRGTRRQYIGGVAGPITPSHVPESWRSTPIVLLGPMAGEVSFDMAGHFPDSLVIASIQGWLRRWDATGWVSPRYWEGREVLPFVDAAIVSVEDFQDPQLVDLWAKQVKVLIVTKGSKGARLHTDGVWHHVAPFPAREVDPTGAGDVFAAAYGIRYRETSDPLESARFASCVASFSVEAVGTATILTRAQVEERLAAKP